MPDSDFAGQGHSLTPRGAIEIVPTVIIERVTLGMRRARDDVRCGVDAEVRRGVDRFIGRAFQPLTIVICPQ